MTKKETVATVKRRLKELKVPEINAARILQTLEAQEVMEPVKYTVAMALADNQTWDDARLEIFNDLQAVSHAHKFFIPFHRERFGFSWPRRSAGYADVVERSFIEKHAKAELEAFEQAISEANDTDLEHVAKAIQFDDMNEIENATKKQLDAIDKSWTRLVRRFKRATGLTLSIGYHNSSDEGDTYFCVGGVYQLTAAGRKHKKNIDRKFFVTFG